MPPITIDLDPTDDPTHGQQELSFFSGHYGSWHYLPLLATLTFNTEPEQYLVGAVLRPGNSGAQGTLGLLRRLFGKLRRAFPRAQLRVRLDGGFAGNPLLDFLEAAGVEYVVALGSNARLAKRVRRLLGRARQHHRTTGEAVALFGETRYAARRWSHRRRVVMKAEVVVHPGRLPKNNPRFVVTNLPLTPAHVYQVYRERGNMENRIKELKLGLALDRTSCSRFQADAFRVLLTVAAYVLFQELRRRAARTSAPMLRSGRCASGCSKSPPGCSAPSAASWSICRAPSRGVPPGSRSPGLSAPPPDRGSPEARMIPARGALSPRPPLAWPRRRLGSLAISSPPRSHVRTLIAGLYTSRTRSSASFGAFMNNPG